jgi:16S rRNA G966 N2-methylase RsmD
MYKDTFSLDEKKEISKMIKNISLEDIQLDFIKLKEIGKNAKSISERCRIGNNIVDYFTFKERLHTKGKYNINYFEFIANIEEFKKKKFIENMLKYYDNVKNKKNTKNKYIVWKETYNICISAINIFRPIFAMEIYDKYKSVKVLDFCAGWGGRTIGACALNVKNYTGIEINSSLKVPYQELKNFMKNKSSTEINMIFDNALNIDYSLLDYDTVFTSPPYYFLEKYENNIEYKSKTEMNTEFYKPLIEKTYKYLKNEGYYILNINKEIYETVCIKLLGHANDIFSLKKSKRQNEYTEYVYVWKKLSNTNHTA